MTLPLDLFQKELDFSAEKPQQTIVAGGSTLGIQTIGFKLVKNLYTQAMERITAIDIELTQPGKLVSSFTELVKLWERLCKETENAGREIDRMDAFFVDAPGRTRELYGLDLLRREYQELDDTLRKGGIRYWTDDREVARTPVFQLLECLQKDFSKVQDRPRQLIKQVEEIEQGVLPSLSELYQKKYHDHLNALTRIRNVQGLTPPMWPQQKADTYGGTVKAFDDLVETLTKEGRAFFADGGVTTFDDFLGLCELDRKGQLIDWENEAYKRHVDTLMRKKLLKLRLVS